MNSLLCRPGCTSELTEHRHGRQETGSVSVWILGRGDSERDLKNTFPSPQSTVLFALVSFSLILPFAQQLFVPFGIRQSNYSLRNTGSKDNTASWGRGDREPYFLVLSVMGRQNSAWEWGGGGVRKVS